MQMENDFKLAIAGGHRGIYSAHVTHVEFTRGLMLNRGTARVHFSGTCSVFDGTDRKGDCGKGAFLFITYEVGSDGKWRAIDVHGAPSWDLPK